LVWLELRLVEPMPTAVRTGSPLKLRQEKIVPLKSFACGHRVSVNSEGDPVVASPQENVITRTSPDTGANARVLEKWIDPHVVLANARTHNHRD
jgi:hypothetical protein